MPAFASQGARILIVEDESIVALDMRGRLSALGYEVVGTATTGADAIALAVEHRVDLILMDIKLRGNLDGVQTAELIRRDQDIPVIFMTAFADKPTLERAKLSEAFAYILKPFQEREVTIAIEMALSKSRIDRELKESRSWLDATLNSIDTAVIALDSENRVVFMNRMAASLVGVEPQQARSRPLSQICTFSKTEALSALAARHEVPFSSQAEFMMLQGASIRRPVMVRTKPLSAWSQFKGSSKPSGTVYLISDISSVLQSERMSAKLSALVHNSREAIISVDRDLRILSWNQAATRMYGYTAEEMDGKPLDSLCADETQKGALRAFVLAAEDPDAPKLLTQIRRTADARELAVSSSVSALLDAEGTANEFALIERDVSAEKAYEASLVEAKAAAEEANRVKSEFLSNMSHELRTPLNSIIGLVELAANGAASAEQLEYLGIARQSADRLLSLIGSILDFAKLDVGRLELHEQRFNLIETLTDTVETFCLEASRKELDLRLMFSVDLPELVIGDPLRFSQVVANLVSNAIKFTEQGGVQVSLSVERDSAERPPTYIIQVRDTGIGIPEEKASRIWERFYQVDPSSTRAYQGMGLGLSIVQSLVSLMGGEISLESELERGSCFTVRLPFRSAIPAQSAIRIEPGVSGRRVLLVHCDEEEGVFLERLIRAWGADCARVATAERACALLNKRKKFDLLLLDSRVSDFERFYPADSKAITLPARLVLLGTVSIRNEPRWQKLGSHWQYLVRPVRRSALLGFVQGSGPAGEAEEAASSEPADPRTEPDATQPGCAGIMRFGNEATAAEELARECRRPEVRKVLAALFADLDCDDPDAVKRAERLLVTSKEELEKLSCVRAPRTVFRMILACRREDCDTVRQDLSLLERSVSANGVED